MRTENHKDGYVEIDGKNFYHSGFQLSWIEEFKIGTNVIFDIGSHLLGDSMVFRKHYKDSKIYAFECSEDLHNQTIELSQKYDINLHKKAISNIDGYEEFEAVLDENKTAIGCGTIMNRQEKHKTTFSGFEYLPKVKVEAMRIDTFCNQNNISHIDLIHMDVEGAEMKCLKGLGDIRPTAIFTEKCYAKDYYAGEGEYDYEELKKYLSDIGYELKVETQVDSLFVIKESLK